MEKGRSVIEKCIQWFVGVLFVGICVMVMVSLFGKSVSGEANIGSFESETISKGWTLEQRGKTKAIELPMEIDTKKGEWVTIKNTLPLEIADGSSLLTRASMADIEIYINGELREEYASRNISNMSYYLPSAYIVAELSSKDAGAEVEIRVCNKTKGRLNEVRIGAGNNVWYDILRSSIVVDTVVLVVLVLGIILLPVSIVMQYISKNAKASWCLGLLMIDVAIWVMSESSMRQLVFTKPSLSQYFAYLSMELIGVLASCYFDEVQHEKFHKRYLFVEVLISVQIIINIILHVTGIRDFYETLTISHVWMAIALVIGIYNVVCDIRSKEIKQYKATVIGMVGFLAMAILELAGFYVTRFHVFGAFMCVGLIVLMVSTVVQVLIDQIREAKERQERQTQMIVNTIETMAGTIDAKDEYTGGHSERVGDFAAKLAKEVAERYQFSERDIRRIRYIGIMHDIGKIGVPDRVLNKTGHLIDEERELMKKHVDIGADIMEAMDETVKGLSEGIRYHHERFDGKGYPKGLAGEEIPLVARIICLADSYDAMTSNRVYRKRLTNEEVREELIRCSGKQFDPELTEVFVKLLDNGEL